MVSELKIGLKSLLQQGLSEPEVYGDLVDMLKNISRADISHQFRKVIHYKCTGYNTNIMRSLHVSC